jgi:hypothetical protein
MNSPPALSLAAPKRRAKMARTAGTSDGSASDRKAPEKTARQGARDGEQTSQGHALRFSPRCPWEAEK